MDGVGRFEELPIAGHALLSEGVEVEETLGTRFGSAFGVGIDAIVEGVRKIGHDLQLDLLAEAAYDGAEAAGDQVKEGWSAWHEAQPVTSTAVTGAAAATAVLAAAAGKRGLLLALTGSAVGGALLAPIIAVEVMRAMESSRRDPEARE